MGGLSSKHIELARHFDNGRHYRPQVEKLGKRRVELIQHVRQELYATHDLDAVIKQHITELMERLKQSKAERMSPEAFVQSETRLREYKDELIEIDAQLQQHVDLMCQNVALADKTAGSLIEDQETRTLATALATFQGLSLRAHFLKEHDESTLRNQ